MPEGFVYSFLMFILVEAHLSRYGSVRIVWPWTSAAPDMPDPVHHVALDFCCSGQACSRPSRGLLQGSICKFLIEQMSLNSRCQRKAERFQCTVGKVWLTSLMPGIVVACQHSI